MQFESGCTAAEGHTRMLPRAPSLLWPGIPSPDPDRPQWVPTSKRCRAGPSTAEPWAPGDTGPNPVVIRLQRFTNKALWLRMARMRERHTGGERAAKQGMLFRGEFRQVNAA